MWEINLRMKTAKAGGFAVQFVAVPAGMHVGSDCFRDLEGVAWRGRVMPSSAAIANEAQKMRTLYEAVGEYGKAVRKAVDPFPEQSNDGHSNG
jgi:hypothetical protein